MSNNIDPLDEILEVFEQGINLIPKHNTLEGQQVVRNREYLSAKLKLEAWAKDRMLEIIGEDDKPIMKEGMQEHNTDVYHWNQLRNELRSKL